MTFHAQDAALFKKLRGAGFTTAMVAPKSGLFRGSSVLINLGEGSASSNMLARNIAQVISIQAGSGTDRGYPGSLMGAVALTRQTLLDARWHRQAQQAYRNDPRQARPEFNTASTPWPPPAFPCCCRSTFPRRRTSARTTTSR